MAVDIKNIAKTIMAVPTIVLMLRGLAIECGWATEAFGMAMTDFVARIVFWLFVLLGVIWGIAHVYSKVRNSMLAKPSKNDAPIHSEIMPKQLSNDEVVDKPITYVVTGLALIVVALYSIGRTENAKKKNNQP